MDAQSFFDTIPESGRLKLDKKVDFEHGGVQKHLGEIADSMDKWEGKVAEMLQLTKADVAEIKTAHPGDLSLQTRAALEKWQEKVSLLATYRNLITVFVNAGKGNYLEAVCRVLGAKIDDFRQPSDHMYSPPQKRRKRHEHEADPTPAISRYATYLRGVYKSAVICSDKFPQIPCEKFINLALVKKEILISRSKADEFTKATLHGHIDEIFRRKKPIEMESILTPKKGKDSIKCVFVEGAPGVGKSTFCWEFCRRWDEIEALKKFKLVYLLRLREKRVREAKSVNDLICHYEDSELCNDVSREIKKSEGKDVLFVLDGFDELPISLRHKSLFVQLIQGSYLSHCTVLVTSRPSATADLLLVAWPQIDKQVELLGFRQEHIEEYARSAFSSQTDSDLNAFLKYISVNPAIRSMMYIPLNSAIVVEVYKANVTTGSPIPQTMTQLYSELCNVLLNWHVGDPHANEFFDSLGCVSRHNELYKPLLVLAKLAFEGMEKQEVIFDELPDGCDHFGLMNASSELYLGRKRMVSYSFLHLTLQEFLAAFHISQLSNDQQKQMFENYSEKRHFSVERHFNVMWKFVAGLTGFKGIKDTWKEFHHENSITIDSIYIQCLYEAQEKVDFNSVFPISKGVRYKCGWMELLDYYALGYFVSASNCTWDLTVTDTTNVLSKDDDVFEMLSFGLQGTLGQKKITSLTIDKLSCSYSAFMQGLLNFIQFKTV